MYIQNTSSYAFVDLLFICIYANIQIRLKIKPNSVRIRFQSCQFVVLPSTGFEPTPLIHCNTIRLALRPAPQTTRPHRLPFIYIAIRICPLKCLLLSLCVRRNRTKRSINLSITTVLKLSSYFNENIYHKAKPSMLLGLFTIQMKCTNLL